MLATDAGQLGDQGPSGVGVGEVMQQPEAHHGTEMAVCPGHMEYIAFDHLGVEPLLRH